MAQDSGSDAAMDTDLEQRLFQAACQVRGNAHAPYSRFKVGAALLDEHGRIHVGCNVENAAHPQALCAEAGALAALVAAGGRAVRAAMVVAEGAAPVTPCGGCRQKLREFAAADAPVLVGDSRGVQRRYTMGGLLPESFGPDHLPA